MARLLTAVLVTVTLVYAANSAPEPAAPRLFVASAALIGAVGAGVTASFVMH